MGWPNARGEGYALSEDLMATFQTNYLQPTFLLKSHNLAFS